LPSTKTRARRRPRRRRILNERRLAQRLADGRPSCARAPVAARCSGSARYEPASTVFLTGLTTVTWLAVSAL
jgi:hypothetical protein